MTKHWASGDPGMSFANLNSITDFDAVVDDSFAGDEGDHYTTVAAAIAGGAKSIYVKAGSYAGFTLSSNNVVLYGARPNSTSFTSQITIDEGVADVRFENIEVASVTGNGFRILSNCSDITLIKCKSTSNTADGFKVYNGSNILLLHCRSANNETNGFETLADSGDAGRASDSVTFESCWSYNNYGSGYKLGSYASVTTDLQHVRLLGCTTRDDAKVTASNHGIYVEGIFMKAQVVGCMVYNCGDGGTPADGIYVTAPSGAYAGSSIIMGNYVESPQTNGIKLSAASDQVVVSGNIVKGQGGTDYVNCASSPGVVDAETNVT